MRGGVACVRDPEPSSIELCVWVWVCTHACAQTPRIADASDLVSGVHATVADAIADASAGLAEPAAEAVEHYVTSAQLARKLAKAGVLAGGDLAAAEYRLAIEAHTRAADVAGELWLRRLHASLLNIQSIIWLHAACFRPPDAAAAEAAAATDRMCM